LAFAAPLLQINWSKMRHVCHVTAQRTLIGALAARSEFSMS